MTRAAEIARTVRAVSGPDFEPVSLDEAKSWCRVDDDDDSQDAVLELLIAAARERAEQITGRAFIERDIEVLMDELPDNDEPIDLPLPPLQSVSYIRYRDTSGAEQELSGSPDAFNVDADGVPGRIYPLSGSSWPATDGTPSNVRIGCRVGHVLGSPTDQASAAADVPKLIKNWLHVRIATFYENREAIIVGGQITEVPQDYVDGLLDSLIVHRRFA